MKEAANSRAEGTKGFGGERAKDGKEIAKKKKKEKEAFISEEKK